MKTPIYTPLDQATTCAARLSAEDRLRLAVSLVATLEHDGQHLRHDQLLRLLSVSRLVVNALTAPGGRAA